MLGRLSFATDEPEIGAGILTEAYTEVDVDLTDEESDFRLAIQRIDAGAFQLDEMELTADAAFGYEPEEEYFVSRVGRGRLRLVQPEVDELFGPGELALIGRPGVPSVTEVEDVTQKVAVLRAPTLREAAGIDPGDTALPRFTSPRAVSPARARTWSRALLFLSDMLEADPDVAAAPLVIGSANRMLAGLTLATFPNTTTAPPPGRDGNDASRNGTIERAIAFIESSADLDIGIGDIAAASRVSRRAIQLAFRRHLDTTPTAYLRRIRLDFAHRELIDATAADLTVTEVAYRWGFSSPSRFAERYRAAFGSSPSETLRR